MLFAFSLFLKLSGSVIFFLYHTQHIKSFSPMPESSDSIQNGTVILPERLSASYSFLSSPLCPGSFSNCHCPFRLIQFSRTNCGNGCSLLGILIINTSRCFFIIIHHICANFNTYLILFLFKRFKMINNS